MVAFICNQHIEVMRGKTVQSPHKALYAGNYDFLAVTGIFSNIEPHWAIIVFSRLPDQFLPVSQHQNAALPGDIGENYRFAEPGTKIAQI